MIENIIKEDNISKEKIDNNPPFRECVDYACDIYMKKTKDYDPCKKEICPRLS